MAINSRPIIADLTSYYGEPLSTSVFKVERIIGLSYEFLSEYGAADAVYIKNALGKTKLIDRKIDGKRGYLSFGNGFPAGKSRLQMFSDSDEIRRVAVVVWVKGDRVSIESI